MNKVCPGLRFVASYSGSKESVLAIHRAIQNGMQLQALLVTYNNGRETSSLDIPKEVLEYAADAAGVPVHLIGTGSEDDNGNFEKALCEEKEKGAGACVFGDIDVQERLEWGEARCAAAGLVPCFPLWQEDKKQLVLESIRTGFRPVITAVDTRKLDASFAGRVLTEETLQEMEQAGIDPCGETGEYYTFATAGPIFAKPLAVMFEPAKQRESYVIVQAELRTNVRLDVGCVQVYTGNGKGKTTASMGLMLRASGAGMKIYFGQFMKKGQMSEIKAMQKFLSEYITVDQYGSGCELRGPDHERDARFAREGYGRARAAVNSGRYDLVVLDEILVAAHMNLVKEEDVLRLIDEKPPYTELVLTGRYATEKIMAKAGLVTEMREIRHYYKDGLPARTGIEK